MNDSYTLIGQVIAPFGIKGELKIKSESDFIEYRFRKGGIIYFNDLTPHEVTSMRVHKNNILITIDNLDNINLVLDKVGMKVYAKKSDIPPLLNNEYYVDSLIGLKVFNETGEFVGTISDVVNLGTRDLLEIVDSKTNKKFLVPFVEAIVKEVLTDKVIIDEIEGLR